MPLIFLPGSIRGSTSEQLPLPMSPALSFIATARQPTAGTLILQCRVKPGASKIREGIASLSDDFVEICVAAEAREGEANKAVVRVLCQVSTLFACPLPSISIV